MAVTIPVAPTSDGATSTSDTQLVLTAPSGITNGDLLIQIGACVDARTLTSSGFTQLELSNLNGANNYVWAKKAASEPGSYTIDASGSFASQSAVMLRVSGALCDNVATEVLVEAGGNATNDQTSECPNVTTPVNDCMVLWVEIAGNGQNAASIDRGSAVEQIDFTGGTGGDGGHISVWSEIIPTAGAVTGAVITRSGFGGNQTFGIVIQPSGGGGSTESRTITVSAVAAVSPVSRFWFRSTVSASGTGAFSAAARHFFRSLLSAAGAGAFSATARHFFRSLLSAAGAGAFNPVSTAAEVIQATVASAGAATAAFVARWKQRVTLVVQGTGAFSAQTEAGTPKRTVIARVSVSDRVVSSFRSDRIV